MGSGGPPRTCDASGAGEREQTTPQVFHDLAAYPSMGLPHGQMIKYERVVHSERELAGEADAEGRGPAGDHLAVVLAGAEHVTGGQGLNRLLDQLARFVEHQLLWVK